MNKLFYIAACGLSMVVSSLQAAVASPTAAPQATGTQTPTNKQQGQTQEAGWMLEASQVAKEFVEDMDKGNYAQVWTRGDDMFKSVANQKDWQEIAQAARKPAWGKVKSRTMKAENIAWDPQGLPKGAYMLVDYETVFDKQSKPMIESLSLKRGTDGKWRVLTYQID